MTKRVAITGPESTGKTRLAAQLAAHYHSAWVPEFARDYLFGLGRSYTYDDILYIAQNQFRLNREAAPGKGQYVFCDTELIVTRIWCEVKYGKCHPWIIDNIPNQDFDLYLLPDIDLPWEPDPQREHPDMREYLMQLYLKELEAWKFPYRIIRGQQEERLGNALEALGE